MMRRRTTLLAAIGAVGAVVAISGCGGSSGTAGSAATPTSSGAVTPGGASPAATELNPPGDIPDNQAYVAYRPAAGGYVVSVPEGWSRSTTANGAAFTDKLNSIRIEERSASAAPTVASVTASDVAALARSASTFTLGKVSLVTRKAGPAVLTTYQVDSAVNPVTGKVVRDAVERYTFWKNGRAVTLTLSAPQGSDNVDPWRIVTNSFAWKP